MINLISKKTPELTIKDKDSIIHLKDAEWKYGIISQNKWFKENIKRDDIHNLLKLDDKLIGYTLLRLRKFKSPMYKNYFLLDTLIIEKESRNKKYSNLLMLFNNEIIINNNKISFLICSKSLKDFYIKYNWFEVKNNKIVILDCDLIGNIMFFNNYKNEKIDEFKFYLNKK